MMQRFPLDRSSSALPAERVVADDEGVTEVEFETIYPIDPARRHGKPSDLFGLWFGANMTMLAVATGGVMRGEFHLTPLVALVAALLGNVVGGVFMALHAAQGPHLGIPQMIQSRAQFGMIGAAPMTALIVLMFLGFAASNLVLGAQGLAMMFPFLGGKPGMIAIAVISAVPAVLGYRAIHRLTHYIALLCGGAIIICLGAVLFAPSSPSIALKSGGHDTVSGFLGAMSIAALWQIAYAPYVSDYSRYLPRTRSGEKQAFHATYWGCVLGSLIAMVVGALAGPAVNDRLTQCLGFAAAPVLGVLSLGLVVANAMTLYCGALSSITVLHTLAPTRRFGRGWRGAVTLVLLFLSFGLALLMAARFDAAYASFLELLMSIMVPWSAINLLDYYVLRHGAYDLSSLFRHDGGVYGRFNPAALFAYTIGLVAQIPFISTGLYTGAMARFLGGADLSWIAGLAVTSLIYLVTARMSKHGR
ncbi:cytosine permease [Asaia siamensis]